MINKMLLICSIFGLSSFAHGAEVPGALVLTGKWGNVWSCTSTFKIKPTTPVPTAKSAVVNISAARNEFEPFQLVLHPTKALTDVKVVPRRLTGPNGAKLDAWNVNVRKVEFVNASQGSAPNPDPLPELQSLAAPKGVNTPVWVTVYVADKTPAGDYTGTIDITAAGGVKLAVPVKLHVWDFALPTVSKLRTAFGLDMNAPANFHRADTIEQKRKLVDIYNKDFWRHRVSPVNPYQFYEPKAELANYQVKVDFSDFDVAVQKFFPMFNSFALPGFGIGDNLGLELGPQSDRLKVEYMRTVAEHIADKGQLQKAYANLLKWAPVGDDDAEAVIDRCRRADTRIKVLLSGEADARDIETTDIVAVRPQAYDEQAAKKRKANGIDTWFTVPVDGDDAFLGNSIQFPAIHARILPWLCWRYGVSGMHYGQTTRWTNDPYRNGDLVGEGRLIYPPSKTPLTEFSAKAPVPSIRWELIREGIEDYDYFRILNDRLDKAKKTSPNSPAVGKGAEALKMINDIASSVSGFDQNPVKLQAVRAKVAEAIEGLK